MVFFPKFLRPSRWVLTSVKLPYSGTKKMDPFKMLDFQRIHLFQKRPWKCATFFAQSNCENKSFEPDHQILSQCPIRRFLTVITNFLGALSQKEDDFSGIINQVLKMFWFQALRKPRFENKGIFE